MTTAWALPVDEVHVWSFPHARADGQQPLQRVLAGYLGLADPGAVALVADEHGRPRLAAGGAFDFNWSHTRGLALIAVASGLRPGIDVEWHRPVPRALALAGRYFSPEESAWLARCAPERREEAFLRLWTAKEAVLKAIGRGLAFGLDRLTLRLEGERPRLLALAGDVPEAWTLQALAPATGFFGTVAWRGRPRTIRFRTLAGVAG